MSHNMLGGNMALIDRIRSVFTRSIDWEQAAEDVMRAAPDMALIHTLNGPPPLELKTTAIGRALPTAQDNRALAVDWNATDATDDGFKASIWVFACIQKKYQAVASVPLIVETRRGKNSSNWTANPDHKLAKRLAAPNPLWTTGGLLARIVMHTNIAGNSILHVEKNGIDEPYELWLVGPDNTSPIVSRSKLIKAYRYEGTGSSPIDYDAEECCHFMFPDPLNAYWGMPPLQPAAYTVDADREAAEWQFESFANRTISDGALISDHDLTEEQWELARTQVAAEHSAASNARRPWVLGSAWKWQEFSKTPAEMDFMETSRLTREGICAAFGVPPPIVGILDKATYENIGVARQVFWEDTIIPETLLIQDTLNQQLVPMFGDRDTLRVRFDFADVPALAALFQQKLVHAKDLHLIGVPFNAINERLDLGFEDIPFGDQGYVQGAMVPVGDVRTMSAIWSEIQKQSTDALSETEPMSDGDNSNDTDNTESDDGEEISAG